MNLTKNKSPAPAGSGNFFERQQTRLSSKKNFILPGGAFDSLYEAENESQLTESEMDVNVSSINNG